MSILESMRSGTDSTAMQVVLALVVVSFVFWYAQPEGDRASVVATVNGTTIMDTEFSRLYRRVERQLDQAMTPEEEAELRERVRQQLIEDEVIRQEARRLGLEVSDTEIARELLAIDFFKDDDGRFDQRIYESQLRNMGYASRADFEDEIRRQLLREKLRYLVFLGVSVSEPILRQAFTEENTRINVEYVRVRSGQFVDAVDVSDAAIEDYLATAPERVQAAYDRDFDRLYNVPEKVRLRMLRLQVRPDGLGVADLRPRLEEMRDRIAAGADMDTLARKWSEHASADDGGDLGLLEVPRLTDEASRAAGRLQPEELSTIYVGETDLTFYRLEERVPAEVIPLEEVEREIAERLLREEQAPVLAARFAEEVHERWSEEGSPPEDLLAAQGIATATTGPIPLGGTDGLFSPPDALLRHAGTVEPGEVLPEVYQTADALWVGKLQDRTDPDMDLYEVERESIREQVLFERRMDFYRDWVENLVAQARVR